MAHRIIFWKPKPEVNVWLPPDSPLGEEIQKNVTNGKHSELLENISSKELFNFLQEKFENTRIDENGLLHWSDDLENGFVASIGPQFLEVCCFDLEEDDFDTIFEIVEVFNCDHYDWGN